MDTTRKPTSCRTSQPQPSGKFFDKLTPAALEDLATMQNPIAYPANRILFSDMQRRGLEVPVIACGIQARAPELSRDIFGS